MSSRAAAYGREIVPPTAWPGPAPGGCRRVVGGPGLGVVASASGRSRAQVVLRRW